MPIGAFAGTDDPIVSPAEMAGWAPNTAAGFRLHEIPGGHFFLADPLASLAGSIADDLGGALRRHRTGSADDHPAPPGDIGG